LDGVTEVTDNRAALGGGAAGNVAAITGGRISGNTADLGGGVWLYDSDLTDATVESNVAETGGGVWIDGSSFRQATLDGVGIVGNEATVRGGGIALAYFGVGVPAGAGPAIVCHGSNLTDNLASDGGGVSVEYGTLSFVAATVLRNAADVGGGASVDDLGVLESVDVDWGVDADDNVPSDVHAAGQDLVGYGADTTFICDVSGCNPSP
ncbi:MAG: hypothetical protein ABMB14_37400, partial [Myxococcota bacterium]